MLKPVDVLMVGVGGQGTILASRVLAQTALETGYDIKVSEIHGMAQRGGSVVTQVRLGEKVFSPLIPDGGADIVLAFEKLEGLRLLPVLKPGGTIIINEQEIPPVPVLVGAAEYPANIVDYIRSAVSNVVAVDALGLAEKCGNPKAANIVLVGVMARRLPFRLEVWEKALAKHIPARLLEVNKAAFKAGYDYK
jgi:indolepyruvate ferredoxin oxidoreductase beta subunit